ncbi:MAG TPA: DUF6516 family protein [Thermodesulfovibrionia bacterium]|nr:DUF6516 family protein [Thermodesulfovibrionia bacterium]
MIEEYFLQIEKTLHDFPNILSMSVKKKFYNIKQGYIGGIVIFKNRYRLDFIEVKDIDIKSKVKYRYQYMDEQQELIFRYDNAPHHKDICTFPHHKHERNEIKASEEPALFDVLLEIAKTEREPDCRLVL